MLARRSVLGCWPGLPVAPGCAPGTCKKVLAASRAKKQRASTSSGLAVLFDSGKASLLVAFLGSGRWRWRRRDRRGRRGGRFPLFPPRTGIPVREVAGFPLWFFQARHHCVAGAVLDRLESSWAKPVTGVSWSGSCGDAQEGWDRPCAADAQGAGRHGARRPAVQVEAVARTSCVPEGGNPCKHFAGGLPSLS